MSNDLKAEAKDHLDRPADDALIMFMASKLERFGHFVSPDAASRLQTAGITLATHEAIALMTGLAVFEGEPELHATRERIENEQRIATLSEELWKLVANAKGDDGSRYVWGQPDLDDEKPEPIAELELSDFLEDLSTLRQSSLEAVEWLTAGQRSSKQPQSNRADRTRYFYWLLILAFWNQRLGRAIKASNGCDRDPYGPLISFIQAFSAGGMSDRELTGDTIRQWIRRNAHRVDDVLSFIPDWKDPDVRDGN